MLLFLHLKEVLFRLGFICFSLLLSFIIVFTFREEFILLFSKSFINIVDVTNELMFTGFGEVLRIYLLISIFISLFITLTLSIINLYLFLLPGLYKSEMLQLLKILVVFFIIWFCILYLIHNLFVTIICEYLLGYSIGQSLSIRFEPRFGEFVIFILKLDLIFVLVFILLGIYLIYIWWRALELETLVRARRWVYLIIMSFIVLLLPADVFLHLLVFLILIFIYEILLLLLSILNVYNLTWLYWLKKK